MPPLPDPATCPVTEYGGLTFRLPPPDQRNWPLYTQVGDDRARLYEALAKWRDDPAQLIDLLAADGLSREEIEAEWDMLKLEESALGFFDRIEHIYEIRRRLRIPLAETEKNPT